THIERDYLIKNVYPKLRQYCQKSYGLDFLIYDMRWGISNEITTSHMTTTVCLNEIKNCQNTSVGPNFVAFLSHRYGSRSLPTRIKANEYEILLKELNSSNDYDKTFNFDDEENKINFRIENMLVFCYDLDDNETPARYKLKHIDKIIKNFKENDSILNRVWNKLEKKLGYLLRALAENCLIKKLITPVEHERYFVSVTEKEIFNGILKAKNVEKNVLYFEREIEDLDENIEKNVSIAKRFTELDKKNCADKEVRNLLDELKYKKIPSKLPESNMFKFKVKWDSKSGISLDTHREYIEKFAETFYEQVKKLIDVNYEQQKEFDDLSHEDHELIQEVIDHACFCNETVSKFHGRADILQEIQKYLLDASNNIPYVLHGESGCGKTAILAKIASEIFKIVPDPDNYCVLLRFLGTTPISSDIIKTFQSLIRQLSKIFNIQMNEFKAKNEIEAKDELEYTLSYVHKNYPNNKIVIILDSIDQLNSHFYNLNWLITRLNRNVKIVFSTLPDHGNILQILKIRIDHQNLRKICSLDTKLAEEIILDWLQRKDRKITSQQLRILKELFEQATLYPLYVKLIFDVVSKWTSFFEPDQDFFECLHIDSLIRYIFNSLEKVHGRLLFSRTIIYMNLFKNGISENEIEDIISLDDDVLYDIFEFHAPPIRKLPKALWSRIKNDLKEYMVEKEVDDTRVIYWYHRRFIEVSNSFYVSGLGEEERTSIFSNIVDFFNETWKNKPKPYKYNDYLTKKFGLKNGEAEEIRETGIQPTVTVLPDGTFRYNKRKLSELPSIISSLNGNIAIILACDLVYFDLDFLTGLFKHKTYNEIILELHGFSRRGGTYSILNDIKNNIHDFKVFQVALLQCANVMKDNPEALMIHFLSRSLNFYNHLKYFTKLIDQYYLQSPKYYSLILAHQFMEPPLGELIFQLDKHSSPIMNTIIGGNNSSLVITISNEIFVFNLNKGINLGYIDVNNFTEEKVWISAYSSNSIQSFSVLKEIPGGVVICSKNEIRIIKFDSSVRLIYKTGLKKVLSCVIPFTENFLIIFYEDENFFEIFNIETNQNYMTVNLEHKLVKVTNSFRENSMIDLNYSEIVVAVCLENYEIKIYAIRNNNGKITCRLGRNYSNGCITKNDKLIAVSEGSFDIFYFDIKHDILKIVKLGNIDAHFDQITFIYPKDDFLLTASKDSSMKVFSTNILDDFSELKIKIHKAFTEVEELVNINIQFLFSKLVHSK
ncbi:NACHT and WD repeat domain-containing 2-like, partial [Brachionus plicatilis]